MTTEKITTRGCPASESTASAGDNLLAVAVSAGVVDLDDEEYCLEGRCGACVMEVLGSEGASRTAHACRESVAAEEEVTCAVSRAANARLGEDTTWTT